MYYNDKLHGSNIKNKQDWKNNVISGNITVYHGSVSSKDYVA